MQRYASLFIGLFISLMAIALLPMWTVVRAQEAPPVFSSQGLVEIIPAGDVIGDGQTELTMHVVALNPDGSPMTGLRLKPAASLGQAEKWSEVSAGVYAFRYRAPLVSTITSTLLEVKGRSPSKMQIQARYKVPVRPPVSTGIRVVANPPRIILGQDKASSVTVLVENAMGSITESDLSLSASVGEIQEVKHLGGGRFSATYVPPAVNYPQLAILSATDLRAGSVIQQSTAIPLVGKTNYPVQAGPEASVSLRIGEKTYGPVTANSTGKARIPVEVPPGVSTAVQVEARGGSTVEKSLDLRVPETSRVAILPSQPALPADGNTSTPVRVVVYAADGSRDEEATIAVTAPSLTADEVVHLGQGIYQFNVVAKRAYEDGVASITVNARGNSVQKATMELKTIAARPQALSFTTQPEVLPPGANALSVFAKVVGADAGGVAGSTLALDVRGATSKGEVQDLGNGDYRIDYKVEVDSHFRGTGAVQASVSGAPLARVLLIPQSGTLVNDGSTKNRLTVVTVDALGYPVPATGVNLSVEVGDGAITPSVETGPTGIGHVYYTSGRATGLVRVRAKSGNRTALVAFLQGPASLAGLSIPQSGDSDGIALTNAWGSIVTPISVLREGLDAGPSADGPAVAGDLAVLTLRSEPGSVVAGGTATLQLDAKDAAGLGIPGLTIELIADQGSTTTGVTDMGGGKYVAKVTLSDSAKGEVRVSALSGGKAGVVRIPVVEGLPSVTPPDVPEDPSTEEPKSADNDGEESLVGYHLRAGYLFGSYRYQQAPNADSGSLLPAVIAVGGENGNKRAAPQGFVVGGEGWFNDYVGFDASVDAAGWGMTAPIFSGTVQDWLINVNADARARFPIRADEGVFWLGARVGYHGSDILYFTGDFETGIVDYRSLYVQGLSAGGEIGGEFGPIQIVGLVEGRTVGPLNWLGLNAESRVAYDLGDGLHIGAGISLTDRTVRVLGSTSGNELGTLTDGRLAVALQLGLEL